MNTHAHRIKYLRTRIVLSLIVIAVAIVLTRAQSNSEPNLGSNLRLVVAHQSQVADCQLFSPKVACHQGFIYNPLNQGGVATQVNYKRAK